MANKVKKFAIYPLLSSGHTNVCVTISKVLLNNYPGQVEIIFVVDNKWKEKLSKQDARFKFRTFEYDNEEQANLIDEMIKNLEPITKLPLIERMGALWSHFHKERNETLKLDKKVSDILVDIKPDLILMDQILLLPSIIRSNCPYAFIVSANPLILDLSPEFPAIGSDAGVNEVEKIAEFRKAFKPHLDELIKSTRENFDLMNVEIDDETIVHKPLCKHFSIYCFPKEIDYYNEEIKKKYKLVSFDTPLIPERLTPPYKLPEEFAKKQCKTIYISLGSMFSMYTSLIQRLINALATLPYKYIVSKGPKGDQIKFPNDNFIGENYIDQLGVLQVVDAMVTHAGNNSLAECFYFGVPCVCFAVIVDQINNAKRLEETGYGFQLPIYDFTDGQLKEVIEKLLHDEEIRSKWKKASERIQKEQTHNKAMEFVFNYV